MIDLLNLYFYRFVNLNGILVNCLESFISMKLRFIILLSVLFPICLSAQWVHEDLLHKPALDTAYSNRISFEADILGFFKNNEYSTPFVKGETFPGMQFIPRIGYQIEDKFRFELGSSGLYYSGDQQSFGKRLFNNVHVRMQYEISPKLHFLLGNYYGGLNHKLIEPLYRWELHFVDAPESGIQIIYEDKKYFADVWLNWQRFIERDDPLQEVLTLGVSSSIKLNSPNQLFSATIPLQLIINHKGGQIDTSDKRNLVIGNLASGVQMKYLLDHRFFDAIGVDFYAAAYYDHIPDKDVRPYDFGWGLYPVVSVEASGFKFMTGYWRSDKFYAVDGESLFGSFDRLYPGEKIQKRNLITNKFSYTRRLMNMLSVGTQLELYSDLDRNKMDYSFGVHLRFDLNGLKWKW